MYALFVGELYAWFVVGKVFDSLRFRIFVALYIEILLCLPSLIFPQLHLHALQERLQDAASHSQGTRSKCPEKTKAQSGIYQVREPVIAAWPQPSNHT